MAKEELSLGVEMGRLEIEPFKKIKNLKEENPFVNVAQANHKKYFPLKSCVSSNCLCFQKKSKSTPICKKKHIKILREPVLKLLQNHGQNNNVGDEYHLVNKTCAKSEDMISENVCALVDNCNQLRISSESNETAATKEQSNEAHWWQVNSACQRVNKEASPVQSQAGSCSQQALNPPCDVTIDELASYFETMVHIPKKMSSMAEMMYI